VVEADFQYESFIVARDREDGKTPKEQAARYKSAITKVGLAGREAGSRVLER
jgi:hypothetical protein